MAVAIPLALAAYDIVSGEIKKGKSKKQAAAQQATRPKVTPSPYYRDDLSLAENELATGVPAKVAQAYEEGGDKDLSSGAAAILAHGGSVNDIGSLFNNRQEGRLRYTMLADQIRMQQLERLSRARRLAEEDRLQSFQFNKWAPWADDTQAVALAREDAENQIQAGINTGAQAGTVYAKNLQDTKSDRDYFRTKPNPFTSSSMSPSSVDYSAIAGPNADIDISRILPEAPPLDTGLGQPEDVFY